MRAIFAQKRMGRLLLGVAIFGVGVAVMMCLVFMPHAFAQPAPPRQPQAQPMGPPGAPPLAPGMLGPQFGMPMPPMFQQPVAICAKDRYIYVVRGNTLYQFTAKELKLLKKVTLELAPMPPGPPPAPLGQTGGVGGQPPQKGGEEK